MSLAKKIAARAVYTLCMSTANIVAIAFLSSFSHCLFMCGGFLLLLNNSLAKALLYHGFRIGGYVFLGLLASGFGAVFALSAQAKGLLFFALGCFMLLLAFALFFRGVLLSFIERPGPVARGFAALGRRVFLLKNRPYLRISILGFLNGLLPCGISYFFLAQCMSQEPVEAAFTMVIFGTSTLPLLLFANSAVKAFANAYHRVFGGLASLLIAGQGLYLGFLGLRLF